MKVLLVIIYFAFVTFFVFLVFHTAFGMEVTCPPPATSCKVITLLPGEEQFLMQPSGVLDIAERGAFVPLGAGINFFRRKIETAPIIQPAPAKPEAPVEPEKKPE